MAKDKMNEESIVTSRVSYGNIINPDRNTDELLEKKITPATIKVLLGQMDKDSEEYKALLKQYQQEVGSVKKPGVIRLNDKSHWEKARNKSQFINRYYRELTEKSKPPAATSVVEPAITKPAGQKAAKSKPAPKTKSPASKDSTAKISTSKKAVVKKATTPQPKVKTPKAVRPTALEKTTAKPIANKKPVNLIKPPIDDNEILKPGDVYSSWSSLDTSSFKNKLNSNVALSNELVKKPIIRRHELEETTEIKRELRPVFSEQITQIKRNGLSVVDFVINPEEKIEIEKNDEEILVRLITQKKSELAPGEFLPKAPAPPKPTPVKIIRSETDDLSIEERVILRLETKGKFQKLTSEEQEQLNSLRQQMAVKNNRSKKQFEKITGDDQILSPPVDEEWEHEQAQIAKDRYKKANYNHQFDEAKKPNLDQRLAYEQRMTQYLMNVKMQYEQGYNRQLSQELADFNRAINLSKAIKTTDTELQERILANRDESTAILRRHVMLLNQKQHIEIRLLNKQLLKNKTTKANIEDFIKKQKEFQDLLRIREEIKENRDLLITSLRTQAKLTQEARAKK
ncbi:hypothetical protein P344_03080 [Spiroplasma mirum ATCC 29335]|uniref:Uncharacterized protein n=1 Tax=Spiroplasma mirum ATCC 29335 TaxID=838561 RepID=W0GL11_9MOLU|nr:MULTISPECIES: hypothetical protein [Spiroplasma]AHF60950.1 hypothetical protein SMM_0523 [Spiroplasma mirum ATCC 29335]AHI57960.1 hypothetical protein P344_03080 [Spiroplasma mirum ATCC 29335]AKM53054.1 hypothetical protein SATRI_v1c05750 [Spiroplasma atrichopogonis]